MNNSKYLTEKEFKAFWAQSSILVETRQYCLEYILERASISEFDREKFAWYGIYKIVRFVEDEHRFPRREEMDRILEPSELQEVKLDQFDFWSNRETLISHSVHQPTKSQKDYE